MKLIEQAPTYTNALVKSSSLYLRQHAHNPVMWYPWGKEAIALAKEKNLPIMLSSGYSACYWCHVMEREVFENVSIASYMNEHFINIKVDREEHPLVDETYMMARQLMTREGGWPNNVFLTPELKPFFATGTGLAEDSPQRPSFPRLLEWIYSKWVNEREQLDKEAEETHRLISRFLSLRKGTGDVALPLSSLVHTLADQLIGAHDDVQGGFFKAPKFPHETYLNYLLYVGDVFQHKPALDAAVHSMLKMAAGGIYDQVGCGFHRYAIDKHWYVPHFEKMLYNQAMCAGAYTKAAALTNNPFLIDVARGTLEFVSGPMRATYGPFFAAIDAETDGVEGAYYSWTAEEILATLTEEEGAFFQHYYALADIPHFPGHKKPAGQALILRQPLWDAAKADEIPYTELSALCGQVLNKLLNVRNQRQAPALDQKIITSWNGLMIRAFAEGFAQFKKTKYRDVALEALRYFYMRYQENDGLHHTYNEFETVTAAVLEDYAYLAAGALSVVELCNDKSINWLGFATLLLAEAKMQFFDEAAHSYRLNAVGSLEGVTISHATDSVLPSAIGVLLGANIKAAELTKEDHFLKHAKQLRDSYQPAIQPQGILEYSELLSALTRLSIIEGDETLFEDVALLFRESDNSTPLVELYASLAQGAVVEPGGMVDLVLKLSISEGWMMDAINSPITTTKLTIIGANVKSLESMELPSSELVSAGGLQKHVYRGDVEIKVKVRCTDIDSRQPIEIQLVYQPCNDEQCYPAQVAKYTV